MPTLSLSLLGPFQATLGGQPITGFESNKVRALLAYLAVEADQPHSRDELIGLLWPDQPDAAARANLRQALANLRQALGDRAAEPIFLNVTPEGLQFQRASDHWIDATAFTALVAECRTHVHRRLETCQSCARRLRQAIDLYRGDFLAQFFQSGSEAFEEWALVKRERLHRAVLDALYNLTEYHDRRAEYDQAQRYAMRQLELDPWREEAHRQLMRALALSGQRSAALAQYETCRRTLADELGAEPAKETTALYEQIKSGNLARVDRRHNLPASPTLLIGRERELVEIDQLLENPACRLVTLVGPGGIGKTCLALQAAREQLEAFTDGGYFVSLAPLSSAEFLVSAIANALKFTFSGQEDPKAELLNYLHEKGMLLMLDNFEHLLEGAGLLTNILQHAPQVVLLVTSRERLNLQWEWLFDIEGLTYPESDIADRFEAYSAVELFVQRARQVHWRFSPEGEEKRAVVRICQLVDGMPLAIELAAAWVRERSCREIADRIATNMSILTTSLRDVPARHRSMQAAFDHSWNLLSEEARRVFRQLSVFRGGFQREAAEQVAGASLLVLAALVDKSFLRRNTVGRYDVHELLRQYGQEKLQAVPEEAGGTHDRHCEYYAEFLHQKERHLKGIKQRQALEKIGGEIENVQAMWRWAVDQGKEKEIGKSLESLYRFYEVRSWLSEGEEIFRKVVEKLNRTGDTINESESEKTRVFGQAIARQGWFCLGLGLYEKAKELFHKSLAIARHFNALEEIAFCLTNLADTARLLGEHVEAKQLHQESSALYREIGDRFEMARSLNHLGNIAYMLGEYLEAEQLHQDSLAIRREIGDQRGMASSINSLGIIARELGEYGQARQLFRGSLVIYQEIGDRWGIASANNNLGDAAYLSRDYAEAKRLYQECLMMHREIGHRWGIAFSLINLGNVAEMEENYREAKELYQEGLAISQGINQRWGIAYSLVNLGHAANALGEYHESKKYFHEALRMAMEFRAVPLVLDALVGIARLLTNEAERERALELVALVLHHPASRRETKDRAERLLAELQSELPPEQISAAKERGATRRLEEAVDEILGENR